MLVSIGSPDTMPVSVACAARNQAFGYVLATSGIIFRQVAERPCRACAEANEDAMPHHLASPRDPVDAWCGQMECQQERADRTGHEGLQSNCIKPFGAILSAQPQLQQQESGNRSQNVHCRR